MQNFVQQNLFAFPDQLTRGVIFLAASLLIGFVIVLYRISED